MRLNPVRWLAGAGVATLLTVVFGVLAPAPAHAAECYTVWVGSTPSTVCPWQ